MTKPKTDKSLSEILVEQEIQRLEENEAEITRLKKQMKPKTDNTSMGNPPTGTYFKEDKQGWVDELYRLISDLLSQQREEVRREVVEEIKQLANNLEELKRYGCCGGGGGGAGGSEGGASGSGGGDEERGGGGAGGNGGGDYCTGDHNGELKDFIRKEIFKNKFWEWFESEKEEAYKRGREDEAIECQKDMERVVEETKREVMKGIKVNQKEFVKLANEVGNILAEEKRTMTGAYDVTTRAGKKRFRDMLRELVE